MLESMLLSVPRVVVDISVSYDLASKHRYDLLTYVPSPTSTIGKDIPQSWSSGEIVPYQRSVARIVARDDNARHLL